MAKNDQQEMYEKILAANHSRMVDYVRFGEAKNAALLTFCSVWIGAIIAQLRTTVNPLPMGYDKAFIAVLPLLVAAAIITLTSLLPKFMHNFHKCDDGERNLLYFRDIACFSVDKYGEATRQRYLAQPEDSCTDRYFYDLECQIAIQARIADRKFRAFRNAGWLVLIAFAVMAIPIALQLVRLADGYAHSAAWL